MQMRCERWGQSEVVISDLEGDIFAGLVDEVTPDIRRAERRLATAHHGCDGCGVITPDVDLWAEDTDTGEELWLCLPCGEW